MAQTQNPFEFGKVVTGKLFTNRKAERERLASNCLNRINSILISPRRWGKSSLVREVAMDMRKKHHDVRFCFIDLFNIRSEHEFYEKLVSEVIRVTSDKIDEARILIKQAFKLITPKLNLELGSTETFSISLDFKEAKKNEDEILNFGEKIAAKKKLNLVICMDEFQNLEFFPEHLAFQKKLRSHWQHHRHVCYCLYGSKRSMMISLFSKTSMPFYRFGDIMFLEKITTHDFEHFIIDNFKRTNKLIASDQSTVIIECMKNHPYYVQQLSHLVWNNTDKKVTDAVVRKSISDLLNQNAIFYQRETDNLSNTQIGLLKAIADEVTLLSSAKAMHEYGLGTSANVKKNKVSLERKEILDLYDGSPKFMDPAFELWFKRVFSHRE